MAALTLVEANVTDTSETLTPPPCEYIEKALPDLFELYQVRNEWVFRMRRAVNGTNTIEAPEGTRYEIKKVHRMSLRASLNERKSKLLPIPRLRIIPPGPTSMAQGASSDLESAINQAWQWIHRQKNEYGRCYEDVLTAEGGVMRWEYNDAAAWPDLIYNEDDAEDSITRVAKKNGGDPEKAREEYKKSLGNDSLTKLLTHAYVPLENSYPFPGPSTPEEWIEVEFRQVKAILDNPLFSDEAKNELRPKGRTDYVSFRDFAPIIRYCNREIYAYYLIPQTFKPAKDMTLLRQLTDPGKASGITNMQLLYHYEHNAGIPLYTAYMGAEGGWQDVENDYLIGKLRAIEELSQTLDDIASQELTHIRNTMWPRYKIVYNMQERPTVPLNDNDPRKITPNDVKDVELYTGESMEPLFMPQENPLLRGFKANIEESMAKLVGSAGMYGIREPGVEGGFQQSTLLQVGDSLFAYTESNMVTSAINDALVCFSLIRGKGEKVWVRVPDTSAEGRKYFKSVCIDPDKLYPMPQVDAIIKMRAPADLRNALDMYIKATTPPNGVGSAAFDRITAREEILDIEQPDVMEIKVWAQDVNDQVGPPVVMDEIKKRYNLTTVEEQRKLADAAAAAIDGPAMFGEDPMLAMQMGAFANGEQPPMQMPPPQGMPNPLQTQGDGGGLPYGTAQPDQTEGRIDGLMEQGGLV